MNTKKTEQQSFHIHQDNRRLSSMPSPAIWKYSASSHSHNGNTIRCAAITSNFQLNDQAGEFLMKLKKPLIVFSVIASSLLAVSAFAAPNSATVERPLAAKQAVQAWPTWSMDAASNTPHTATRTPDNRRKSRGSTGHQRNEKGGSDAGH